MWFEKEEGIDTDNLYERKLYNEILEGAMEQHTFNVLNWWLRKNDVKIL
jgi:hypothetical protein